jgi:xylulokinase
VSEGPTLLAGLDVGTTYTKAGIYRADGTVVAQCQAATPADDAEPLRAIASRLLTECVERAGAQPIAVGVASMAETGVPLDAEGLPIGTLLNWRDQSARREAEMLGAEIGPAAFFATTGLRPSARLPLARWIRLRRHAPERLRRMSRWAGAADLVVSALTGSVATSPTLAARTGAYDINTGAYVPELLALAGLRPERMPPVVASGEVAGKVTATAAALTGLRTGTPVVVAGHDHLAAAWAAGVRGPGRSADSMGTAEAIVTPVGAPPPCSAYGSGTSVGPFVDGRSFCLISGLAGSGGLVEWVIRRFAPPGCENPQRWFTDLVGPPYGSPGGITVQPYLHGRACPDPDPDRTLSVHGLRPEHGTGDLARAVLEGLSMQVRWMLESQALIGGARPGALTVFGGPAANPTWMWIKSQLTPVPVTVLRGPQCAALGAAQLAGRAIGVRDRPATGRSLPTGPAPEWEAAYRDRFLPLVTRLAESEDRCT